MRPIDADLLLKEIKCYFDQLKVTDDYYHGFGNALYQCQKLVEQQPTISKMETTTWIPCSDRPPEESGDYLCYEEYEPNKFDIFIEEIDCDGIFKQWNITNSERIIAWQPLPKPYKKGE